MFACPGQENPDERCSLEDAENFFLTDIVGEYPSIIRVFQPYMNK